MMPIWKTAMFIAVLATVRRIVGVSARTLIVLLILVSIPIWSRANDLQDQLNSEYKGKNLLLRGFYSGDNLAYDQNGDLRVVDNPGSWTLAEVQIESISVTTLGVDILGDRLGVLYTAENPGLIKVRKLKIHIDANTQPELNVILPKIFIDPKEELRPLVPDYWKYFMAGTDLKSRKSAWENDLRKSPVRVFKAKDFPAGELKPPRAVSAPDPKYTLEAASRHIEGTAALSLVVDTKGAASDVAIIRPIGLGLDEQAVIAVKKWHFQPAMRNGEGVPVEVNIEITFRCCPLEYAGQVP
jgi:TonB family protein